MKSSFLIREKTVKKAYGVKNTGAKHIGQDWSQALIFTYMHWCNCLTNNKCQRLVSATIPQQFALVGATVSGLNALKKKSKQGPDLLL